MKILKLKNDKRAVVWISTVIYTLIGLSIIAILLVVVNPRIKELKDSFVIKQTIVAMDDLDNTILDILKAAGNKRYYEFHLSRGNFRFDCSNDIIEWNLDESLSKASEPGVIFNHGDIQVLTTESNNNYLINLKTNYSRLDLTCSEDQLNNEIVINPASTPYKIYVENKGENNESSPRTIVNIVLS